MVVYTMLDVRNHDHIGRETQIRMTVETAAGVLAWANQLETSGKMPREEAQGLAKQVIAQLRYGKDAYFFISDMASPAKFIMHPITPERNGQAAPRSNGPELLETFAKKVSSEKSGFVSYLWSRTSGDGPVEKLAFDRAVRVVDAVSQGDLTVDIRSQGTDEIAQLLRAMVHMQSSLLGVVRSVRAGSENLALASAEIAQGNNDLSAARFPTSFKSLMESPFRPISWP